METKEQITEWQDAFERIYPLPAQCSRCGHTYAAHEFNAWSAHTHINRWEGYLAAMRTAAPVAVAAELVAVAHAIACRIEMHELASGKPLRETFENPFTNKPQDNALTIPVHMLRRLAAAVKAAQ